MDKISVKMSDAAGLRTGDAAKKSGGAVKEVSDDFKMLLQNQNQREDSKEISKDTKDTKTETKSDETKDKKDVKDTKDEPVEEDAPKDDKVQTESLLAVYQMSVRPEMVQVEQQPVEEAVPELQVTAEIAAEPETSEIPVQAADTVQPEMQMAVETQAPKEQKVSVEETKQPEMTVTPKEEVKAEAPKKNDTPSDSQEEHAAQSDSRMAEQAVHAPAVQTEVKTEVQEPKVQEPVRMQVPQPEELPSKLTDQIMTKMSEGVQEFEIHIEPANLGRIAVKILYQEGQATVSIFCSEKKALDVLGRNAGEIGQVIEKNLGGTTTIIVDKQESDYLNQTRDENQKNGQEAEQEQQKNNGKDSDAEDAEQFLQKLRLGLAG